MYRLAAMAVPAALLVTTALAQDLDPELVTQPDDVTIETGGEEMLARGEELWNDETLGTSGLACQSCHAEWGNFNETFNEPYPHPVQMAQGRAGLDEVNAAEMVQLCMVVPMAADPLAWDSEELAALTAYTEHLQEQFAQR